MGTAMAGLPSVAATRHVAYDSIQEATFKIYDSLKAAKLPTAWQAIITEGDKRWHRANHGIVKALGRIEIISRLATPELYCGGAPCDHLLWDLLVQSILVMEEISIWLQDADNHKLLWREQRALCKVSPERLRAQMQVLAKLRNPTTESEA